MLPTCPTLSLTELLIAKRLSPCPATWPPWASCSTCCPPALDLVSCGVSDWESSSEFFSKKICHFFFTRYWVVCHRHTLALCFMSCRGGAACSPRSPPVSAPFFSFLSFCGRERRGLFRDMRPDPGRVLCALSRGFLRRVSRREKKRKREEKNR